MNKILFRIAVTGIFAALCFVLTAFCQIPYAGGAGYLNFGDISTLFIAMAFGPIEGAIVGMIGGSMGDLFLGYAAFAPFTLLAKGIMGLATGFLFLALKKHKIIRFISPFIGATLMIGIYMIAYAVIEGKGVYLSSAFDCVQGYGMSILSIIIYLPIEKSGILSRYRS